MKNNKISIPEIQAVYKISKEIISQVGEPPKLKGVHKKLYEKYCDMIDESYEELKSEPEFFDPNVNESIENEKLYIECFARWLQEESGYRLVKK